MAAGNFALALLAVSIAQRGEFSVRDVVFWTVVAALVWIRYLDVTRLGGLTADGARASLRHWRRYCIGVAAASTALWGLAHVTAYLLADR